MILKYYLYRGISNKKFYLDKGKLIPRKKGSPESVIKMDDGHFMDEGLTADKSINNSVVIH